MSGRDTAEEQRECPNDGVEMDLFGPVLSGPWDWVCPTCGHRESSGIETPEDRLQRKYRELGKKRPPANGTGVLG